MSKEFFIRSYHEYALDFQVNGQMIEIPSISARPKNIASVNESQLEVLKTFGTFKALLEKSQKQGLIVLDKMPADALDANEKLAAANEKMAKALEASEQAKRDLEKMKMEKDRLERQLEENGGTILSVDESIRRAQEETELYKLENESMQAELAALRAQLGVEDKPAPKKRGPKPKSE